MLANAIRQAEKAHRMVIEQTYDGICNIYRMQSIKDPETKVTRQDEGIIHKDISCHLSYSKTAPAVGSDTVTAVTQTIKLFLAPELVIPPGSRIEVTQQSRTESYDQSGKAAVYSSHQEILLELWEGYT